MIRELIAAVVTFWVLILAAAVALAAAVLFYRRVISKEAAARNRSRALRWRIKLKLRPGPGYASLAELVVRWSRPAAFFHGARGRPGLTWADRLTGRTTEYAVRIGRAQYFRCLYSRLEDQVLVLAPQRTGKSGVIADRIVDHPGAVLATSTKADLLATTGADRARLGPVCVFNPQGVGDVTSSLRWDMLGPCRDLVMARRMAAWLTGGAKGSGHGNIEAALNASLAGQPGQMGPFLIGGGQQERGLALRDIGQPQVHRAVMDAVLRPVVDPPVSPVAVPRGQLPGAQLEPCLPLPALGEPADLGQRATVFVRDARVCTACTAFYSLY